MTETIVTFTIDKLLQFANTEAELIGSIPGEIRFIGSELESIKVVLKDAEIKAEDDEGIKVWVRQVREVAYQIEDAIDDYLFLQRERKDKPLVKLTHFFTQLWPKHELANTIKMIKDEIIDISSRRQRYELRTTEETRHERHLVDQTHHNSPLYLEDTELVGIEVPGMEVTRLLEQSPLVALVGMGGLGKSTLARKVYNQVRERFHISAWVTVSQSYSAVDLLKSVYKQFYQAAAREELDGMQDLNSITEALRNYLNQTRNRYLVVFDDVWVGGSLINCIRDALPATNDGSKILITMRDEEIATFWTTKFKGHMYHLNHLPNEETLYLFCKQIFGDGECPGELRLLVNDIVRKCDGLPLVLVAVGGLLSTKSVDYSEWAKLRDSLGSEFSTNRHLQSSTRILLLSYQELPYYLKPCFLYFGIFPEDYSIDCKRLFRLWIAEGFIESCRGKTLEEVALEYLTSLVKRNLVHVSARDVAGRCRSIRVHDVLREIILSKLEESGFAQVATKNNPLENTHFRRLSIHNNFDESIQKCSTTCDIRSFILAIDKPCEVSSFLTRSQRKLFRFLRVLDLQNASIYEIPKEVGDLHNLHLLNLRNTMVSELPKSIGRLWNLQTLDLRGSNVFKIPRDAKYLHKLRHLIGFAQGRPMEIPEGVLVNFRELQTLKFVDMSQSSVIMELRSLKQLTTLRARGGNTESLDDLFSAIGEMEHLRSLRLLLTIEEERNLDTVTHRPRYLESLLLGAKLKKLPYWIVMLTSLTKLKLRFSKLVEDPAPRLQGLANLVELQLYEAYTGEKLDFGFHGFQKLKALNLIELENLKLIKGGLPALRRLQFGNRYQRFLEVPPHIKRYVDYSRYMPNAFFFKHRV